MDLLSLAKELFFPNGKSKKGNWEDLIHNVYDFKECELDDHTDVGELYELSKFGMLRFYLHTAVQPQEADTDKEDDSALSDTPTEQDTQSALSDTPTEQDTQSALSDTPTEQDAQSALSDTPIEQEEQSALSDTPTEQDIQISVIHFENSSGYEFVDLRSLSPMSDPEVFFGPGEGTPSEGQLDDTIPLVLNIDSPVTSTFLHPPDDITTSVPLASTPLPMPMYEIQSLNSETPSMRITLHRANLFDEMIIQFKDPSILDYPLNYSMVNERGRDEDGVARDVYTVFWNESLDRAAEGAELRIPSLSPRWQEDEWKAVGRILAKGWMDQGYFPVRLAPAFTTALLFGEHAVSMKTLFESFRMYLSQSERDVIDKALNEDLDGESQDELLDILDRLGVKIVPKRENLKAVLLQAAHKQIWQQLLLNA
jgi:hypothetical protein